MSQYPILLPSSTDKEKNYELPDGWSKKIIQRQSGLSLGDWDAYLYPPPHYKHKRLRSVVELMHFLKGHPECPIDGRVVNMEKNPDTISAGFEKAGGTTKNLLAFIDALKSGQEFIVKDFIHRKQNTGGKKKETSGDGEGKGKKYKRRRLGQHLGKPGEKEADDNQPPPEPAYHFTLAQALRLEKLFHSSVIVPMPFQLDEWSTELGLGIEAISEWFKHHWKARIEADIETEKKKTCVTPNLMVSRVRQPKQFCASSPPDPFVYDDLPQYNFEYCSDDDDDNPMETVNADN